MASIGVTCFTLAACSYALLVRALGETIHILRKYGYSNGLYICSETILTKMLL